MKANRPRHVTEQQIALIIAELLAKAPVDHELVIHIQACPSRRATGPRNRSKEEMAQLRLPTCTLRQPANLVKVGNVLLDYGLLTGESLARQAKLPLADAESILKYWEVMGWLHLVKGKWIKTATFPKGRQ